MNKGVHKFNARLYDEAEEQFREALLYDPDYARAHLYRGNACYKMHRTTEAVSAWQRAAAAEPGSQAARDAAAKLKRVGKGAEDALSVLRRGREE